MRDQTKSKAPPRPFLMGVEVSMFKGVSGTKPTNVKLSDVLDDIQGIAYEAQVKALREIRTSDPKKYDGEKKKLLAFTISGTCSDRKTPILHSNLLQVDLDDLGDKLPDIRRKLQSDPYVCFVFLSPSGDGLKVGLRIDGKRHRESFTAAESYFLETYGIEIDPSVKDRLRLCFVSHDPELWINKHPRIFPISPKGELLKGNVPKDDDSKGSPPYTMLGMECVCPGSVASACVSEPPVPRFLSSEPPAPKKLESELDEKIRDEIDRAVEFGAKSTRKNNEASFRACLVLIQFKGVEDLSGMSRVEQIYFADCWYQHLLSARRTTKSKSHYYSDIFTSIKNAKRINAMNNKNPIPLAWELAQKNPSPPETNTFEGDETMRLLISLCYQLHVLCDGGEWFLARNKVGELMGLDATATRELSKNFNVLVNFGILEIVTPPNKAKRQATTYRYVEQGQPRSAAKEGEPE